MYTAMIYIHCNRLLNNKLCIPKIERRLKGTLDLETTVRKAAVLEKEEAAEVLEAAVLEAEEAAVLEEAEEEVRKIEAPEVRKNRRERHIPINLAL
jgi:hypothetical protein